MNIRILVSSKVLHVFHLYELIKLLMKEYKTCLKKISNYFLNRVDNFLIFENHCKILNVINNIKYFYLKIKIKLENPILRLFKAQLYFVIFQCFSSPYVHSFL